MPELVNLRDYFAARGIGMNGVVANPSTPSASAVVQRAPLIASPSTDNDLLSAYRAAQMARQGYSVASNAPAVVDKAASLVNGTESLSSLASGLSTTPTLLSAGAAGAGLGLSLAMNDNHTAAGQRSNAAAIIPAAGALVAGAAGGLAGGFAALPLIVGPYLSGHAKSIPYTPQEKSAMNEIEYALARYGGPAAAAPWGEAQVERNPWSATTPPADIAAQMAVNGRGSSVEAFNAAIADLLGLSPNARAHYDPANILVGGQPGEGGGGGQSMYDAYRPAIAALMNGGTPGAPAEAPFTPASADYQSFGEGGTVRGAYPGQPVMVEAHAGETVRTPAQERALTTPGCLLATHALDAFGIGQDAPQRRFFARLARLFVERYPETGLRQLALYQSVAKAILAKLEELDPTVQAGVQKLLYDEVIAPTGATLDAHEVDATRRRLVTVTVALAKKLHVPLPLSSLERLRRPMATIARAA